MVFRTCLRALGSVHEVRPQIGNAGIEHAGADELALPVDLLPDLAVFFWVHQA
jgi:hypothetical protein